MLLWLRGLRTRHCHCAAQVTAVAQLPPLDCRFLHAEGATKKNKNKKSRESTETRGLELPSARPASKPAHSLAPGRTLGADGLLLREVAPWAQGVLLTQGGTLSILQRTLSSSTEALLATPRDRPPRTTDRLHVATAERWDSRAWSVVGHPGPGTGCAQAHRLASSHLPAPLPQERGFQGTRGHSRW